MNQSIKFMEMVNDIIKTLEEDVGREFSVTEKKMVAESIYNKEDLDIIKSKLQ
jgi:hypothetical protein